MANRRLNVNGMKLNENIVDIAASILRANGSLLIWGVCGDTATHEFTDEAEFRKWAQALMSE